MKTSGMAGFKSLVILMSESEQPEGISSRKLVVETAKHNVITAYNPTNGLELLRRFPAVDAVLLHAAVLDHLPLIEQIREISPDLPIIIATPRPSDHYEGANYIIPSHEPQLLLDLLSRVFGVKKSTSDT